MNPVVKCVAKWGNCEETAGESQRLAALLNKQSKYAVYCDPLLDPSDIGAALGLSDEQMAVAADELSVLGWVKLRTHLGMGKAGFGSIYPTPELFWETDMTVHGWDSREDARTLATTLTNSEQDSASLSELDQRLDWGPRRLNPAADYCG